MTEHELETLRQFFGYFHEDWTLDAQDANEVLASFLQEGRESSELKQLSQLIIKYARSKPTDEELEMALFKELGCYYPPSSDGLSAHRWLLDIAERFSKA